MSMHGSYDDYEQNDTADLVRSVALSSAKLWEEVFDRLRRLEEAQVELRAMLGRIEGQLPAGPTTFALGNGSPAAPQWPDRAIGAAAPADPGSIDREPAHTDLFGPGPVDDPHAPAGHIPPRDAVDLLVGNAAGPDSSETVEDEPATFFFPPAVDDAPSSGPVPADAEPQWIGSDVLGSWTSTRTVRYDEGFTSRDVVGPPTEEVQAIDASAPERTNAEYFGRHAAGPPPGFAVANGDVAGMASPAGSEAESEPQIPQVRIPEPEAPFDPIIQDQLQQAAQAAESFASGAAFAEPGAQGFGTWGNDSAESHVPLVFAPGTEPIPQPVAPVADTAPLAPPGFATGSEPPAPPFGFGAVDDDVPPPPPGFAPGADVATLSPEFAPEGEVVPPPPLGFESTTAEAPFAAQGFVPGGTVPPPPLGFVTGEDLPPPPPGFATGGVEVPPPPPGFGALSDEAPAPPPGFGPGLAESAAVGTPAPPPGFTTGAELAGSDPGSVPPPPPPGFAPPAPTQGFATPGAGAVPPPPPGFASGANGQHNGPVRTHTVSGSIADDVLSIGSMTPPPEAHPGNGVNGNGEGTNGEGNGNGLGPAAEDGPPPPITPDFFARAGRRRR